MQALLELIRFDVLNAISGFAAIHRGLARRPAASAIDDPDRIAALCQAVALAGCFYWKPVLCFQRSVAAARLLRRHGIGARFVIGYRPMPFLAHAWVEVDGRVVNDSAEFAKFLRPLYAA